MLTFTSSTMVAEPNGSFMAVSRHPWVTGDRLFPLQSRDPRNNRKTVPGKRQHPADAAAPLHRPALLLRQEQPRIKPERVSLDVQRNRGIGGMGRIQEQVALVRLDVRGHPQAQAGA